MRKYVHIVSLGCAKNLVDTEVAAGALVASDIGLASSPVDADVFFINTCSFIPPARDEAESYIKQAVQWKKADGARKIIVGGCLPNWDREKTFPVKYPAVDAWTTSDDTADLPSVIHGLYSKKSLSDVAASPSGQPSFLYNHLTPRLQLTPTHYAYLKISDGCDNRCSYCAIPGIRGKLRSRTVESVVEEAANLVANGVKELILTAQDTTAFNQHNPSEGLATLIREMDKIEAEFDTRLLYAHPARLSPEIIGAIAGSDHMLHYLDMPLQHISARLLSGMNRKVTPGRIRAILKELRRQIPDIAIRTTFLVGFPGETEEDFQNLLDFVREQRFHRLGVFTFFSEPGTKAAKMPKQVPFVVAEERRNQLMAEQMEISAKINKSLVGSTLRAIVDDTIPQKHAATARTYMDAPEIDNTLIVRKVTKSVRPGDCLNVRITKSSAYDLHGIPA